MSKRTPSKHQTKVVAASSNTDSPLTVAISSRAVFQLDAEDKIWRTKGTEAYRAYQRKYESKTEDADKLVKDKLIKAFHQIGRPLFVEHTGLYIDGLNNLPAGLTQIFWDRLQADRFAELVGSFANPRLTARTMLGYCDGRKFHFFEGAIAGRVPKSPAGDRGFQWDCVFVPDGESQTFAEMGARKNEISMRRRALDSFAAFLKKDMRK